MTTTAKLSLEDFLKQPETKPYREYWDGEVTEKTMGTLGHSLIQHLLSLVFAAFIAKHPLGIVGPEVRCLMRRGGRRWAPVPDFVFVSFERLGNQPLNGPLQNPPDFVVEVLSPDDRMTAVMARLRAYLENGVRLAWLVDPERRTVLVMTAPDSMRLLTEDDMVDGGDVLPGFSASVREILPPLVPLVSYLPAE